MFTGKSTLRFASALSQAPQPDAAVDEVIQALTHKPAGRVDLLVMFASAHHRESLEQLQCRLAEALEPRVSVGATAAGVIGLGQEIERSPGLAVLVAEMPGVLLHPFSFRQSDWPAVLQSPQALRDAVQRGRADATPPKAVLMLADPFSTPTSNVLQMFSQCWPKTPVMGGLASAGTAPGGNRLLLNGQLTPDAAVGVAFGGPVRVDCTVSQGCRPIGKPYVITRSQRHIVQELGGRSALRVIHELIQSLDDEDRKLVSTRGLVVGRVINEYKDRFGVGDFLIRHLVGVDQTTGQIAIGDPQIRVGQTIQFHVHDHRAAEQDLRMLLQIQKLHGPAEAALLFSCNGRGTHLFGHPHADVGMVQEALGQIPLAGCFAAGELGPIGEENFVHGHTASLLVFRSLSETGAPNTGSQATPAN